jgi:hypothetical protein
VETVSWRVPVRVAVAKVIVAAVFVALALTAAAETWQVVVALVAAGGTAAWAVRDVSLPVRVAADPTGVALVAGLARRFHLPWSRVRRVRVDTRRRSRMLEIDDGETLHLVSRYEVDADLEEVAARLEQFRSAAP